MMTLSIMSSVSRLIFILCAANALKIKAMHCRFFNHAQHCIFKENLQENMKEIDVFEKYISRKGYSEDEIGKYKSISTKYFAFCKDNNLKINSSSKPALHEQIVKFIQSIDRSEVSNIHGLDLLMQFYGTEFALDDPSVIAAIEGGFESIIDPFANFDPEKRQVLTSIAQKINIDPRSFPVDVIDNIPDFEIFENILAAKPDISLEKQLDLINLIIQKLNYASMFTHIPTKLNTPNLHPSSYFFDKHGGKHYYFYFDFDSHSFYVSFCKLPHSGETFIIFDTKYQKIQVIHSLAILYLLSIGKFSRIIDLRIVFYYKESENCYVNFLFLYLIFRGLSEKRLDQTIMFPNLAKDNADVSKYLLRLILDQSTDSFTMDDWIDAELYKVAITESELQKFRSAENFQKLSDYQSLFDIKIDSNINEIQIDSKSENLVGIDQTQDNTVLDLTNISDSGSSEDPTLQILRRNPESQNFPNKRRKLSFDQKSITSPIISNQLNSNTSSTDSTYSSQIHDASPVSDLSPNKYNSSPAMATTEMGRSPSKFEITEAFSKQSEASGKSKRQIAKVDDAFQKYTQPSPKKVQDSCKKQITNFVDKEKDKSSLSSNYNAFQLKNMVTKSAFGFEFEGKIITLDQAEALESEMLLEAEILETEIKNLLQASNNISFVETIEQFVNQ
eukprot:NODE_91_length_21557_cov_0.766660.p3 type:complete len:673 gc:universal NODE_91_length_21557_cov_0.766660:12993-15011(+)